MWQLIRYAMLTAIVYGMTFVLEDTWQVALSSLAIYLAFGYLEAFMFRILLDAE